MLLLLAPAQAALTVIGTQYKVDQMLPEFDCFWASSNYPTSCPTNHAGATVYVYVKNTGGASETISDATLAGYSLATIIKTAIATYNPDEQASIYFYWDNPPQQILDAGEPIFWKADPATVAVGAVGQVTVRLRYIPTNHVSFGVVSSSGTITTNITVDNTAPRISSIGYSEDRTKVYLQWRRAGGAAPTSVYLNGTNVTSLTTTVGDTNVDYASSVVSLGSALPFYSVQVYQGIYGDGKTATAGQRVWTNKFIYCTWSTFETDANYDAADWLLEAWQHGFNNIEMNLGAMGSYMGTSGGRSDMQSKGYGYTILDKTKLNALDPDLWFLNDEPDAEEYNQGNTHCGTGTHLPCDVDKWCGTLVIKEAVGFAAELHNLRPNVPTTVNLDGGLEPQSFFIWGAAVDVLESDNYYEPRLKNAYLNDNDLISLQGKPKLSYAVARNGSEGAAPNPFRHILYANKDNTTGWPYPFPASKHIEAYYSLAGGSKGMGYWWFNSPEGLYTAAQSPALWKEMGLIGNEIKTARDLIVRSMPVNMTISANNGWIWARGQVNSTNTMLVYVVNENFFNDQSGCHTTNVANAIITNTLPSWMVSTNTTAFEITTGGRPADASWTLNGNQFVVYLGTLKTVRLVVITKDTGLKSTIQSRFDSVVKTNLCVFAPEYCYARPAITLQPTATNICTGTTTMFKVSAVGSNSLAFQWQLNGVNLADGGHFSGATSTNLTVSTADANDAGNYRCVISATGGTTNSSSVALTLRAATMFTLQPAATNVCSGGTATFTVAATGDGTVTYQWQKNGVNLSNGGHYSGVTTTTLTITSADSNDAANYRCVATAGCGSSTSFQAALTVGTAVTTQPSSTVVCAGANATFNITAAGSGTLTYQWRTNGVNISNNSHYGGATSATLTVTNVSSADAVNYDCVATGSCGSATSSQASLTLGTTPSITLQPVTQTVNSGSGASFTVAATGFNLTYQWQKNGANLSNGGHYSGVTTTNLTVSSADINDAANYRCVVTGCGTAISSSAALIVNTCTFGTLFGHGDMEDASNYGVCPDWNSYDDGPGNPSFGKETTTIHGGLASQRCENPNGGAGSLLGVRQNISANVGDAFTFEGWVNPVSNPGAGQQVAMVVQWDGSTADPQSGVGTWKISSGSKNVWTKLSSLSGNATATSVTLFLDSRRTSSSQNLTAYWDDVVAYRAHLPPAPYAVSAGSTSVSVDPLPGCNWINTNAQIAVTIGGGAYTSGTHWVQANGTISTTTVWQTDAAWSTATVTGLSTGTNYTFKVKARYSGSVTQETSLSLGTTVAPTPPPPPSITAQPSAQNLCAGANATFTVAATGEGTLTYQWQTNSVNISNNSHYGGATSATLTVTNVGSADAVNYRCVVSNAGGSTNSSQAALTLKAATTITGQPSAQNVCPGANANFSVTATGDGTLTYQWQTNGVNISDGAHYSGCTTANLTVNGAGSADAVNYRCVVVAGCGSANSSTAALTLKAVTSITGQPSAQNVCAGVNTAFSVTATGDGTLTYQWQTNNVNISNNSHYGGATSATLWVTNSQSADQVNYRCVVTGGCGSANSSSAALTLKAATTITTQPSNQTVNAGDNTSFTVAATGDGTVTYQWQTNSVNISNNSHYGGATSATLWVTNCSSADGVNYRCVVTAGCGSVNSSAASLTVNGCNPGTLLGHGDMEDASSYSVCPDWSSYSGGNGTPSWSKETTTIHGGSAAQKCRNINGGAGSILGVRQTISANVGDAFTFDGWVNPASNPNAGQQVAMVAYWAGTASTPATNANNTWVVSSGLKNVWTHLQNLTGNATSTNVTLFLDSRRMSSSQDISAFWDDVTAYRAFVPPAPVVTPGSSTSLNVNPSPGCNSGNASAEYAISIGGGAYTLGTHFVQANGTVSTTVVWQTDATWGTKTVTGLSTGTTYTFKVQARYSSSVTQASSLGAGANGTP